MKQSTADWAEDIMCGAILSAIVIILVMLA